MQEMENVTQQNEWLNSELQEKIQELMNSRKEKVVKFTRNNNDNFKIGLNLLLNLFI